MSSRFPSLLRRHCKRCRVSAQRSLGVRLMLGCLALLVAGCTIPSPFAGPATVQGGPIYVPAADSTRVWERTVEVLREMHFTIARENRLEGVIETNYKPGATVLEPWHQDSVGLPQRLESTLQSIRRRVLVTFQAAGDGGNFIRFRVDKEIEDLPGLAANSPGAATFLDNSPLQRDLDPVVGQSVASSWLPRGRDVALEAVLANRLRLALQR